MKHKLNTDRMRDISNHDASCNAFQCRQNNAKNDNVVLCKVQICTMYIKLLNALNKLFQLGNIA